MFCDKCGREIIVGAKFCEGCGSKLEAAPPDDQPTVAQPTYAEAPTPPPTYAPPPDSQPTVAQPTYEADPPPPPTYASPPDSQPAVAAPPDSQPTVAQPTYEAAPPPPPDSQPTVAQPTYEMEPQPPPTNAPPPDSQPTVAQPTSNKAVRALLSALFGLVTFALLSVSLALFFVRPANVPEIVKSVDFAVIIEQMDLSDEIIDNANKSGYNLDIDIDDMKQFLKRENVSAEIGNATEKLVSAIQDGDYSYYLDSDEIIGLLKSVETDIRDEFDVSLTDEDYDSITKALEKTELEDYRVGKLMEEAKIDTAVPYLLFSGYPLLVVAFLCTLFVFDIFLVNRGGIHAAFLAVGIPIALSGALFASVGLFPGALFGGLLGDYTGMVVGVAGLIAPIGIIVLAVGILAIVAFFVIRPLRKRLPPKNPGKSNTKTWRLVGLVANTSLLLASLVFALLLYLGMP